MIIQKIIPSMNQSIYPLWKSSSTYTKYSQKRKIIEVRFFPRIQLQIVKETILNKKKRKWHSAVDYFDYILFSLILINLQKLYIYLIIEGQISYNYSSSFTSLKLLKTTYQNDEFPSIYYLYLKLRIYQLVIYY